MVPVLVIVPPLKPFPAVIEVTVPTPLIAALTQLIPLKRKTSPFTGEGMLTSAIIPKYKGALIHCPLTY